jgi:hypothetical protein
MCNRGTSPLDALHAPPGGGAIWTERRGRPLLRHAEAGQSSPPHNSTPKRTQSLSFVSLSETLAHHHRMHTNCGRGVPEIGMEPGTDRAFYRYQPSVLPSLCLCPFTTCCHCSSVLVTWFLLRCIAANPLHRIFLSPFTKESREAGWHSTHFTNLWKVTSLTSNHSHFMCIHSIGTEHHWMWTVRHTMNENCLL